MQMKKFSKIGKLSTAVRALTSKYQFVGFDENNVPMYDKNAELPTIKLYGTVKLHGCVHKDTLVTLANGEKVPINSIKAGNYVLSYNHDTCEDEAKKVSKCIVQSLDKEWVRLVFDKTTIVCTEDHKIWTENRGYVEASKLSCEDSFKSPD